MEVKRGVMFRKERVACSTGNNARRLVATGWLVATGAFFSWLRSVHFRRTRSLEDVKKRKGTRTLMDGRESGHEVAAFVIRNECGTRK